MAERHRTGSHDNVRRPTRRVFLGAAAVAGVLAPVGPALAASAPARGARAAGLVSAAAMPSSPSGTISAFTGLDATGTQVIFPTSGYHSEWIDFGSVVGFHPSSIINNSGSDIWIYDQENAAAGSTIAGPYCAFGTSLAYYNFISWMPVNSGTADQGYTSQTYQPGWFFIQYNVNTGATQPPAPPA
jgi:hypothetical protein